MADVAVTEERGYLHNIVEAASRIRKWIYNVEIEAGTEIHVAVADFDAAIARLLHFKKKEASLASQEIATALQQNVAVPEVTNVEVAPASIVEENATEEKVQNAPQE